MKIVVTEPQPISQEVRSILSEIGTVSYGPFEDRALEDYLLDCDILMVRLGVYIGDNIFRVARKLRYLVSATTGLDHIDLEAAASNRVKIICLRDCPEKIKSISSTAEHTLGLLLALARSLPQATSHVLNGNWNRNQFWGHQLQGKQLGIVGFGRIGRMVANYGIAFGMQPVAYDIDTSKIYPPILSVSLEELVNTSDFISVHVTADPENHHLIDQSTISQFKTGSFFVNTSRGRIVDSRALADAVISGKIMGAAVDVIEGEEFGEINSDPLVLCAREGYNVIITPHIGGATVDAISQAELSVVSTLKEYLSDSL
ncbi:MAG: hydroxyacid dehydrogenase [Leptolyngbya sp. SIOISBB]|nr:hydroxyacid dehydrogenase [Leptolyngbya sp. SIOISBB]